MRCVLSILLLLLATSASDYDFNPPSNRPYFPIGLAQSNDFLAVLSNDADLRYTRGNVLLLDLQRVEQQIDQGNKEIAADLVVSSSLFLPPLAQAAVFQKGQNEPLLLITGRGSQQIISLKRSEGTLSCLTGEATNQECAQEGNFWPTPSKQPYFIRYAQSAALGINGVIGYLSEADNRQTLEEIQTFALDDGTSFIFKHGYSIANLVAAKALVGKSETERRRAINAARNNKERVHLGDLQFLEKGRDGFAEETLLFASFDQRSTTSQGISLGDVSKIIWFPASLLASPELDLNQVEVLDLTALTNAQRVRRLDFWVPPSVLPDGTVFRVYILFQGPDSMARLDFKKDGAKFAGKLSAFNANICDIPEGLFVSSQFEKIFVSCFGKGQSAVASFNPETLVAEAFNQTFGRGPFDILIDERLNSKPRLYVSYFLDGTIGVFDAVSLNPLARIFSQSPLNQEGGI